MKQLALVLLGFPSLAYAQPQPEAAKPLRQGFELSFGLSAGHISCESQGDFCDDITEAGGANLGAAYFFNPTVGIYGDVFAMSHREDEFTFTHFVNTIGVKWRPAPILTLTGGIGAAHATVDYRGTFVNVHAESDDGFAILAAASLDLIRSRSWALAVEGRVGAGFYGDKNEDEMADVVGRNFALGAAFNYFGF